MMLTQDGRGIVGDKRDSVWPQSSVSVSVGSLERSWRLERLLNLKRGKTNHIDPLSIQHCGASYELELYGSDHSRHAGWFFQWGSRRSESDDHMHLGRRC